ncbi:hypothetical protein D3C84_777680 [compost metagenome]
MPDTVWFAFSDTHSTPCNTPNAAPTSIAAATASGQLPVRESVIMETTAPISMTPSVPRKITPHRSDRIPPSVANNSGVPADKAATRSAVTKSMLLPSRLGCQAQANPIAAKLLPADKKK